MNVMKLKMYGYIYTPYDHLGFGIGGVNKWYLDTTIRVLTRDLLLWL